MDHHIFKIVTRTPSRSPGSSQAAGWRRVHTERVRSAYRIALNLACPVLRLDLTSAEFRHELQCAAWPHRRVAGDWGAHRHALSSRGRGSRVLHDARHRPQTTCPHHAVRSRAPGRISAPPFGVCCVFGAQPQTHTRIHKHAHAHRPITQTKHTQLHARAVAWRASRHDGGALVATRLQAPGARPSHRRPRPAHAPLPPCIPRPRPDHVPLGRAAPCPARQTRTQSAGTAAAFRPFGAPVARTQRRGMRG
jgi:hypothetical protein